MRTQTHKGGCACFFFCSFPRTTLSDSAVATTLATFTTEDRLDAFAAALAAFAFFSLRRCATPWRQRHA